MAPNIIKFRQAALIAGILLIAMNLRPAITAISPLAERMHADGLSRQLIGSLTAIPLLLFSMVGLWAGWTGQRIGFARALGLGMFLLALGCGARSLSGDFVGIFRIFGTVFIGAGIALGNVLLPGLVKSRFPKHMGILTSLYATGMNLGAALGIALAVPMANALSGGWNASLAIWGVAAFLMLIIWAPQMIPAPLAHKPGHPLAGVMIMARKKRAWHVMLFMGLQSSIYYSTVAWLPTMLQSRGMSEELAAGWVSALQLTGCVASLVIPILAGRAKSQSPWVVSCVLLNTVGLLGVLLLPIAFAGWAALLIGFGINAGFGLVLLMIGLRSRNPETAASLSSFAQAGGYMLAAPSPWLVGLLSTTSGGWHLAFGLIIFLTIISSIAGYFAGKNGEMDIDGPDDPM